MTLDIAFFGANSFLSKLGQHWQSEEQCVRNPNELFGTLELWLVRSAVFVIFLIGLYKVVADTLEKILK